MSFNDWLNSEEGRVVMETIRQHVSYASREAVEQAIKAVYLCGQTSILKQAVNQAA